MQLKDYFEFEKFDNGAERIRVNGTRVPIELLIDLFNQGKQPAEIQASYPTVELEQVFATITYYLHNKAEVDAYIQRSDEWAKEFEREFLKQPLSPLAQKLRKLAAERDAKNQAS